MSENSFSDRISHVTYFTKVFCHFMVKLYWSYAEPYCCSSPSHRWRLEKDSGFHSPPAKMWWTLNYLADRSYSPPAPNRGLCQVLTSTSSQCTGYLTKQISAYAHHSHFMTGLSFFSLLIFIFPIVISKPCTECEIYCMTDKLISSLSSALTQRLHIWCSKNENYVIHFILYKRTTLGAAFFPQRVIQSKTANQ